MPKKNFYQHLARKIPNNFLTRFLISKFSDYMVRSESKYQLKMRFRSPKRGHKYKSSYGDLDCQNARHISIYAVERYGYKRKKQIAEQEYQERQRQRQLEIRHEIQSGVVDQLLSEGLISCAGTTADRPNMDV
jgi:hypothetical protein